MNFLGANRLRIVQYFDELKAKVDVCVETCIAAHHQDKERERKINQVRANWFKAIDEREKLNLSELEEHGDKCMKLEDEELFKKFMFEFEVHGGTELIDLRIIAINAYMAPGKVECFQIAMKVIDQDLKVADLQEKCLNKLFVYSEKTSINVKKIIVSILYNSVGTRSNSV
jgi:hypothetical protein